MSIPPSEESHNYNDWVLKTCFFDFPQQREAKIIGILTKNNFIKTKELIGMKSFKEMSGSENSTLFSSLSKVLIESYLKKGIYVKPVSVIVFLAVPEQAFRNSLSQV